MESYPDSASKAARHDPRIALARGSGKAAEPFRRMLAKPIKVVPIVSVLVEQFKVEKMSTREHEPFRQGLVQEPCRPEMGRQFDYRSSGSPR
jgi:hypothetical protein